MITADLMKTKDHDFGVRRLVQTIEKIYGYKRTIIKGDGEPALQALIDKVRILGQFEAPEEGVPVGDSQSAGDVENAVERVEAPKP